MDYYVEMNKAQKDIIYSATIFHDNIQNTSKIKKMITYTMKFQLYHYLYQSNNMYYPHTQ